MPRFLAIDADAHGLTVAAGSVRGGAVLLERAPLWLDAPQPLAPSGVAALAPRLAELLKSAGIAPAPVLFALGRDKVVMKELKHPPSAPQDEPAIVRFQAMKEFTESPDDGVLDYVPLGAEASGERRSLVAFVNKDVYAAAQALCDGSGLKLAVVSPRPFAAASAAARAVTTGAMPVPDVVDAAIAVLTLNETSGEFAVVKNGVIRFSRPVSAIAMASEAALVGALRNNLAMYAAQSGGDAVQAIYLAEADAGLSGWSGRLGASLPVPVYPFDPLAGFAGVEAIAPKQRARFAGVVGLLAGQAKFGPSPINFAQPRQPKAAVDPNRNRNAVVVLVGLVLLAGVALGGYILVSNSNAMTASMRRQVEAVKKQIEDAEPNAKRLAAAEDFEKRGVAWIDELYDLSVQFPDINKMKVTSFVGTAIPPPTAKDKQRQTLSATQAPRASANVIVPVAKLRLQIASENATFPEELVRSLSRESRYYSGVKMTTGPLLAGGGSRTPTQQFIVDAQLAHRSPADYLAKLRVTVPKPVEAEKPAAPVPDDFPNGFDPDGGNP
ncbi:MAG: hypothetical protein KF873_17225 [Gemmataceae bacterium]|nr:hypothetical protein [Gemmataceae bacterium]